MTIILSAQRDSNFFGLSDLLVSRPGIHDGIYLSLPSDPEPGSLTGASGTVVSMSQKSVLLSEDRLAMWAGDVLLARKIVDHLSLLVRTGWRGALIDALDELDLPEPPPPGFALIFHRLEDGILHRDHLGCRPTEFEGDTVLYAGSGAAHFLGTILPTLTPASRPPADQLLLKWLNRLAYAFYAEVEDKETIPFAYGGWFELVSFKRNGMQKTPYVIKRWHINGRSAFSLPAYGCFYSNNDLFAYRLNPRPPGNYEHTDPAHLVVVRDFLNPRKNVDGNRLFSDFVAPELQIHITTDDSGALKVICMVPRADGFDISSTGSALNIALGDSAFASLLINAHYAPSDIEILRSEGFS